MTKLAAIFNIVAGCVFTGCGAFVVYRTGSFLSAAPRDHEGMVAWAFVLAVVGICVVFSGLGYVRVGANLLWGSDEMPEDS